VVFSSCEKQIEFNLPDVEQTLVVEGKIESGQPPIVFLTTTQGYFDPIDSSTFDNIFINDATVSMFDGFNNYPLTEINFGPASVYTTFDPNAFGVDGRDYVLNISYLDKEITAQTQIPYPVPLDSVWFELSDLSDPLDSLGFLYAEFADPDTAGNCYRWFSKRINSYTYNYDEPYNNVLGQQKDSIYIAPFGSATDDKFFNGLTFEFAVARGEIGNFEGPDDEGPEESYFKIGDTVAVQATSITYPTYLWVRSMEDQAFSAGSPFASPGNLPTNIQGDAVGVWAGYGIYYDTIICQ
ncbi:DUF4249 domain-containing protein, partial [Flavobacteriales bacterium]|nr:DUF4249 domain-containing protein [Flavobacteriales bacterium]